MLRLMPLYSSMVFILMFSGAIVAHTSSDLDTILKPYRTLQQDQENNPFFPELVRNCSFYYPIVSLELSCPTPENSRLFLYQDAYVVPSCIMVSGFSAEHFEGNGLYCISDSVSETIHYTSVYAHESVRYEIRPGSKPSSWVVLRVERTNSNKWMGTPLYVWNSDNLQGKVNQDNLNQRPSIAVPMFGWKAVKANRITKKMEFDSSEPGLSISRIRLSRNELTTMWSLFAFTAGDIGVCTASLCDANTNNFVEDDESDLSCSTVSKLSGRLAEVVGNNVQATSRYEKALACLTKEIALTKSSSRFQRWSIADLASRMATTLTKTGQFQDAIQSIEHALQYSSEDKQRLHLYFDMGDLKLARGLVDDARLYYIRARDTVKKWGGNIDLLGFLSQPDDDSIGQILTRVIGGKSFTEARSMVLRKLDPTKHTWDNSSVPVDWLGINGATDTDGDNGETLKKFRTHADIDVSYVEIIRNGDFSEMIEVKTPY